MKAKPTSKSCFFYIRTYGANLKKSQFLYSGFAVIPILFYCYTWPTELISLFLDCFPPSPFPTNIILFSTSQIGLTEWLIILYLSTPCQYKVFCPAHNDPTILYHHLGG